MSSTLQSLVFRVNGRDDLTSSAHAFALILFNGVITLDKVEKVAGSVRQCIERVPREVQTCSAEDYVAGVLQPFANGRYG